VARYYYEKQYYDRIVNNLKKRKNMGFEMVARNVSIFEISEA